MVRRYWFDAVVENMPRDQEVMGLNPVESTRAISISVFSVLRQASRGDARLLSFSKKTFGQLAC